MADETVASLGFAVDSKPLDDAKGKLGGVATEADKTGKAVELLGTKFNGLGSSISGSGGTFQKSGDMFANMAKGIAAANKEIETTAPKVQGMGAAIAAAITKSVVSFDQMKQGIAGANTTLATHKDAVEKAASAHGGLSTQSQAAFHSVRSLAESMAMGVSPAQALTAQLNHLSFAASGPGGITAAFAGVARMIGPTGLMIGGLAGVAAVGTALAKVADEVQHNKTSFEALTGSAKGGLDTYNAVRDAAHNSGVEFDTLKAAVDKATQGLSIAGDKNVIYANSADKVAKFSKQMGETFGEIGKIMQTNGANAEEEARVFGVLGQSIGNTGTLTVDAFKAIRDNSLPTARAISNAFGYQDIDEFQKQLAKTPITAQQLIDRINLIKPEIDKNFDAKPINTVEQATRQLGERWGEFVRALADVGAFNVVKGVIEGLTSATYGLAAAARAAGNAIDVLKGKGQGGSSNATYDAMGNVQTSAGGPGPEGTGNSAVSNFDTGNYAGQILTDNPGGAGTINLGSDFSGVTDNLPAFAGGGQLTVGGTGGTDTTLVQFKATPGEVVTVSTPGQMAQTDSQSGGIQGLTTIQGQQAAGVIEATPDPASLATVKEITDAIGQSTIDISKKVLDGSDNIVTALNKLIGGVASTTVNPSTGLPVRTADAASRGLSLPASVGGGSAVGGGVSASMGKGDGEFGSPWSLNENKRSPAQQPILPLNYFGNPAYDGGSRRGQAAPIRRSRGQSQFPSRTPINPGSTVPVNPDYSGFYDGFGDQPISSPVSDYYGTADGFNGSLSDIGGGMSDYYGTDYSGSGMFNGSLSDIGTTDVPYGSGGVYGFDGGNGGFDTGAMDYGGGSADYGYFATGGQFTVAGSGGTDSQKVSFKATPGEVVTVSTPGTVTPSTPNSVPMPAGLSSTASAPSPMAAPQPAPSETKTIHMYLANDVQANQIIKSRAQIQRAMFG